MRAQVSAALDQWREMQAQNAHEALTSRMDDEEAEKYARTGSTAKVVDPFEDGQK